MIRYPGHEAAMWTLILSVGALATALSFLGSGDWPQAALLAPLLLACMGLWAGIDSARCVILLYQALLALRTVMKLVDELQIYTLMKCLAYVYVFWFFARWKRPARTE